MKPPRTPGELLMEAIFLLRQAERDRIAATISTDEWEQRRGDFMHEAIQHSEVTEDRNSADGGAS